MGTKLYAIRTLGAPFVKVGTALDPEKRLKELQTGCPHKLYLYATRENSTVKEELQLHKTLMAHNTSGEWFTWSPDVESIVNRWRVHKPQGDAEEYTDYKKHTELAEDIRIREALKRAKEDAWTARRDAILEATAHAARVARVARIGTEALIRELDAPDTSDLKKRLKLILKQMKWEQRPENNGYISLYHFGYGRTTSVDATSADYLRRRAKKAEAE